MDRNTSFLFSLSSSPTACVALPILEFRAPRCSEIRRQELGLFCRRKWVPHPPRDRAFRGLRKHLWIRHRDIVPSMETKRSAEPSNSGNLARSIKRYHVYPKCDLPAIDQMGGAGRAITVSGGAGSQCSRRSRARSCDRTSRPRRISPAKDTGGICCLRDPRATPA
jgi:hypothetical protein